VVIKLEGGKAAKQRHFFEDERVTFKEVLSPGDGKTFPSNGQTVRSLHDFWPNYSHTHLFMYAYIHIVCACVASTMCTVQASAMLQSSENLLGASPYLSSGHCHQNSISYS
jgi:hypothetical protein